MHRLLLHNWAGLLGLALLISGCSDPFAPPTRVKSLPKSGGSPGSKPSFLVFVVPALPRGDLEVWTFRAQHEANDKRAVFRIMGPSPTETPAAQPEVVRRALADGASALIVYPGDSPDLAKVLAESEAKGVPVILVDKKIAAPEGSKPFTVVEPAPCEDSAGKIVEATIEDLKKAGKPVDGTALILVDSTLVDTNSARRVDALKSAAGKAKFRQVLTASFDGNIQDSSRLAVLDAIKANPDLSVVLTDDGEGLVGAAQARAEAKGMPVFFVGGFTDYRSSRVVTPPSRESCYVEGRFTELGAQAVLTALARLRGDTVGEHVYQASKFTKAEGAISSEKEPNSSFPTTVRSDQVKPTADPKPIQPKPEPPKESAPKPQ